MGNFRAPFRDLSPIRMTLVMAGLFGFNGLSIIPAWWHTNSLPLCWISGIAIGVAITMAIWAFILHKWRQHQRSSVDGKYPVTASVFFRQSTNEWVLELVGTINDCSFVSRHTQPADTKPEDVPGLPTLYKDGRSMVYTHQISTQKRGG